MITFSGLKKGSKVYNNEELDECGNLYIGTVVSASEKRVVVTTMPRGMRESIFQEEAKYWEYDPLIAFMNIVRT